MATTELCRACKGIGYVTQPVRDRDGALVHDVTGKFVLQKKVVCEACHGVGRTPCECGG